MKFWLKDNKSEMLMKYFSYWVCLSILKTPAPELWKKQSVTILYVHICKSLWFKNKTNICKWINNQNWYGAWFTVFPITETVTREQFIRKIFHTFSYQNIPLHQPQNRLISRNYKQHSPLFLLNHICLLKIEHISAYTAILQRVLIQKALAYTFFWSLNVSMVITRKNVGYKTEHEGIF